MSKGLTIIIFFFFMKVLVFIYVCDVTEEGGDGGE